MWYVFYVYYMPKTYLHLRDKAGSGSDTRENNQIQIRPLKEKPGSRSVSRSVPGSEKNGFNRPEKRVRFRFSKNNPDQYPQDLSFWWMFFSDLMVNIWSQSLIIIICFWCVYLIAKFLKILHIHNIKSQPDSGCLTPRTFVAQTFEAGCLTSRLLTPKTFNAKTFDYGDIWRQDIWRPFWCFRHLTPDICRQTFNAMWIFRHLSPDI